MVEIIKESNDDLNKNLFLKELSKIVNGITLQITRISDVFESKRWLHKLVNSKDFNDYYRMEVVV